VQAISLTAAEFAEIRKREDCFRAFRNSHWIGAAVLAGILAPMAIRMFPVR